MTEREQQEVNGPLNLQVTSDGEMTKAELQQRMDEARESISQTVDEIKETVEDQYETVRATVTGIFDWREQFQKDPIIWSVGALCAGFALGHTLARAQRKKSGGIKDSKLAAFTDSLVAQLGDLARQLPIPALDSKLKHLLGFGLSEMIAEMDAPRPKRTSKTQPKAGSRARRKLSAKRRPAAKSKSRKRSPH
jgi:hypothetical protein